MGGGGTTQQSATQSTNVTQLPPWVSDAAQQNYGFAQSVANRPLQQYQGQMVADVGPQMQQSWNLAAQSGQAGAPEYNSSEAAYLNAAGYNPNQVTPQTLAGTNLQPYMNPFTNQVINTAMPLMQQQLAQTNMANANNASQARAFGGSRLGVQQGVTNAQGALQMGQLGAQLQSANFGQAQQAATGDITRDLQAQQANQQANQAAINSQLTAAGGLGTLGQQAQANQQRQFLELQAAGSQEQMQAQQQINAQMAKFNQAWGYPSQQLGTLLSALGMTPYGTAQSGSSTTQTQTESQPSIAEAALGGLNMAGSLFGGSGPFGAAGAFAGLIPGSDPRMKKNISPLGPDPMTGVPLHAFHYKGMPGSAPKVIGAMSPDVERSFPGSTFIHPRTGMRMLNPMRTPGSLMPRTAAGGAPPIPGMGTPPPMGVPTPQMPGALSSAAPMGQAGALASALRLPRTPRNPRIPRPAMTGALVG